MRKRLFVQLRRLDRGQSLVELTLFLPILILLLVGLVEIGVLVNSYISSLDASRASARYVSAGDPLQTGCNPFGDSNNVWIDPGAGCNDATLAGFAPQIKAWGTDTLYQRCQTSNTLNFFYISGCMAVLNLPRNGLDPAPKSIWGPNDWAGDDVVVTTVPITNGVIMPAWTCATGTCQGYHTWSLFGNQPTAQYPSYVDTNFSGILASFAQAPSTGMVVVEVYHSHPQFTKLFAIANRLVGGRAILPDPIPIHTYSVFPLPAVEPRPIN